MGGPTRTEVERLVDACLMPGFDGTDLPDWVARALDDGLAGVALYGGNVGTEEAVGRLSSQVHARRADALVALDEEGGDVTRLDYGRGSRYPGNLALGVVDDEDATSAVAHAIAGDLRRAGVNLDFAPSVDVNSDPGNPVIGVRSFGADPDLVARHGAAFVRGLQAGGVAAVVKHFPGHGSTTTDSHLALPVIGADEATIRARDLPPFVAAIRAGARGVMTGHLLVAALDDRPATLSRRILHDLLREELGFDGVVVTDALEMAGVRARHGIAGAAVLALGAGADLLLLGAEDGEQHRIEVHDAVARAVDDGDLSMHRLEDAATRVRGLAAALPSVAAASYDRARDDIGASVAARAVRVIGALPAIESAMVVELRGTTNLAVGAARWSLADAMDDLGALAHTVQVTSKGPSPQAIADQTGTTPMVIAVRDACRSDWQRAWVQAALAMRPDAVLVCLGMPDDASLGAAAVLAHGAARANVVAAASRLTGRVKGGVVG